MPLLIVPGQSEPTTLYNPADPKRPIKLDSRAGKHILNDQYSEITELDRSFAPVFRERFPDAKLKCHESSIYNCHGLTFASRRTNIVRDEAVAQCLSEDGYRQVHEKPLPGDIVIYRDEQDEIIHSGIVSSVNDFGLPVVVSKWGGGCEAVHVVNSCPYSEYTPEYYRIFEANESTRGS